MLEVFGPNSPECRSHSGFARRASATTITTKVGCRRCDQPGARAVEAGAQVALDRIPERLGEIERRAEAHLS